MKDPYHFQEMTHTFKSVVIMHFIAFIIASFSWTICISQVKYFVNKEIFEETRRRDKLFEGWYIDNSKISNLNRHTEEKSHQGASYPSI